VGAKVTFVVVGLIADTTYNATVASWNATGPSPPSASVQFTTAGAVIIPTLPPPSMSWWWILLVLAVVPILATLLYKTSQSGWTLIGGAKRKRSEKERSRRLSSDNLRSVVLRGARLREQVNWTNAGDSVRDAFQRAGEKTRDVTSGLTDRIARFRYRRERRRR
jgi:hypothetical protein